MLTPVEDGPAIVVCNTCRFSADAREDGEGRRGGAVLAERLAETRDADPRYAGIAIQQMPCLFACSEHCTVHLRAPDKVGYVLGRFTPDAEAARAILDYTVAYLGSDHGKVPFSQWPQAVKGHFIVRVPPAGLVVES
jgi:predicted metal-binding protein